MSPWPVQRYQKRVSGPILDRIDIHVDVPSVETQKLIGKDNGGRKTSKEIQKKVQKARDIQTQRFKKENKKSRKKQINSNAEMNTKLVKKYCPLSPKCRTMMQSAVSSMNLSARSYFKVIKVARTVADLEGSDEISTNNLAEALQYRPKDDN